MTRLEERMVAIPWHGEEGASLEGIVILPGGGNERGAVIAPPHPLYGGTLESPVVSEIAYACSKHGISSLRFNWRGVGASAGTPSGDTADADVDVDSALAHVAESVDGPVVACGYSFGAAAMVRLAARSRRIDRLVLVAPPPPLVSPDAIVDAGKRTLILAGTEDSLAPLREIQEPLLDAPGITLHPVKGADHFFQAGLAEIGKRTASWLAEG